MSVCRIVEPLEKWERISRHASQETAHEKHIANVGVALKAIVHDGAHGSTDEPSDSNIINSSTKVHSLRMRTSGHGMPDNATEEAHEGKRQERCLGYIYKSRGIEYRDAID